MGGPAQQRRAGGPRRLAGDAAAGRGLPVPPKKGGGALTARAHGYLLTKYATLARIGDVSPHDLRHRFGYRMARTVPPHRLAQIMGHDALDTTRLYVGGTRQDRQHAVEAIARA